MTVPSDVKCVELIISGTTSLTKRVDVTPGNAALITVTGVPIGPATIDEKTYNVSCDMVIPGVTQPTWVATMPASVTLAAGVTTDVALTLKRPPQLRVSNDFQDSPALTATPAPIAFGTANTAGPALTQAVTVSNTGTIPAPFAAAMTGSDAAHFSVTTSGCPTTGSNLQVGGSCSVTVRFAPTVAGPKTAYLSLGMPAALLVPVKGDANTISLSAAPVSINFGSVFLSSTVAGVAVTLTNTGNVPVVPTTSFTGSNPTLFPVTGTNCPATLGVGASCQLTIGLTTTAPLGAKSATLNIGSPTILSIPLSATVTTPVTTTPSLLTFATTTVGASAPDLSVTVANTGTAAMNIASAFTGTDAAMFGVVTACPTSLAAGANCTLTVRFTPASTGAKSATLTLGSPTIVGSVALAGTGAAAAITAPASVSFPNQLVGTPSASQMITISNTGVAPIPFGTALAGTDAAQFSVTTTCPQSGAALNSGASCTATLTFTPTSSGTKTATLALGVPAVANVALSGMGVPAVVAVNPPALAFASVQVGGPGSTQVMSVKNNGALAAPLTPTLTGTDAAMFIISANNCPVMLNPGTNCAVTVKAAPATSGAKSATLSLGTAATIPLSATGVSTPTFSVFPAQMDFGALVTGATPAVQTMRITSTSSTTPINLSRDFGGTDAASFGFTSMTCLSSLTPDGSPNSTCTLGVQFTPSALGAKSAFLSLGTPTVATVPLAATVVNGPAAVTIAPATIAFASQPAGDMLSTPQSLTVTNTSGAARAVPLSIVGANPGEFVITSTTCPVGGATLAAGASCQVQVRFAAVTLGNKFATLTVGAPIVATAPLTGTGG